MLRASHYFLSIFLLSLAGCSAKYTAPSATNDNRRATLVTMPPEWVSQRPVSQAYYTGIGGAAKSMGVNYTQSAKKSALEDLISEIQVKVSSSSFLHQMDKDNQYSEEYQAKIKTTAENEIQDFELVDSWEDGTNYWVYYRLSKAKYRALQEQKRAEALAIALDYYKKGQAAEKQVNNSLSYHLQALYSMRDYLGESNAVNHNGQNILLGNEVFSSIQRALNKLVITVGDYPGNINRRLEKDLLVNASVREKGGNRLSGVPLTAYFAIGGGAVHDEYTTNNDGEASVIISKINSKESKQKILVVPDLEKLSKSNGEDGLYSLVIGQLVKPQGQIVLQVSSPSIYLSTSEKSLGARKSNLQLTNRLKTLLAESGFTFANTKNKADLWIDLDANTEKGPVSGSIHITYLTMTIKVVEITSGQELYTAGLDRVKGYSLDFERSSQEGYNQSVELLEKETVPALVEAIL